MQTFHNLHTLRTTYLGNIDLSRIHACIAPFPATRALRLDITGSYSADALSPTPQTVLSHLERYNGPAEFLPLVFAGAAAPEELAITRGSTADILDALRAAEHPASLLKLSLGFRLHADVLNHALLLDLLGLCLRLAHLTLAISSDGEGLRVLIGQLYIYSTFGC
ncbi:hypothetical protein C8R43DRAFT_1119489 [Mycena crocata]|nr:hypothetical protein C8R43DRAFT_1119489 [Mycena crocata]